MSNQQQEQEYQDLDQQQDKYQEPCKYFNTKYNCKKDNCKFLHVKIQPKNKLACRFYGTENGCVKGDNCTFQHIIPKKTYNKSKIIIIPCKFGNNCNKGNECKYSHQNNITPDKTSNKGGDNYTYFHQNNDKNNINPLCKFGDNCNKGVNCHYIH